MMDGNCTISISNRRKREREEEMYSIMSNKSCLFLIVFLFSYWQIEMNKQVMFSNCWKFNVFLDVCFSGGGGVPFHFSSNVWQFPHLILTYFSKHLTHTNTFKTVSLVLNRLIENEQDSTVSIYSHAADQSLVCTRVDIWNVAYFIFGKLNINTAWINILHRCSTATPVCPCGRNLHIMEVLEWCVQRMADHWGYQHVRFL